MTRQSATKKLVAAIALTIGLFGALIDRVEAHTELTRTESNRIHVHGDYPEPHRIQNFQVELHGEPEINSDGSEVYTAIRISWDTPPRQHYPYERTWNNNGQTFRERLIFDKYQIIYYVHDERDYAVVGVGCIVSSRGPCNTLIDNPSNPTIISDLRLPPGYTPSAQIQIIAQLYRQEGNSESRIVDYLNYQLGYDLVVVPGTPISPEPETPEPETPTTPNPSGCSFKHRLTSVPAMTGGGYTSQILISSEQSNATATIRAYQSNNGNQIDVLDSEGNAVNGRVSLAPANSSKRFRLEGIQGWHSVIVEHPTERAMNRATVVMRLREPGGGISIVPMEGVSDCVTTG